MDRSSKIFVAGHRGLVGGAVVRNLTKKGFSNLLLRTRAELDLCNQSAVNAFFTREKPDYVILAAAKVGGILYNQKFQAEFLYDNMMIAANVIHAAAEHGTQKLLFLGSSCIYPKMSPQPIVEDSLLTGPLEPTNEGYAIAKIAGLKLCEKYSLQHGRKFISIMPTNLYGPGDNFHPGLFSRHSWDDAAVPSRENDGSPRTDSMGSGSPRREFLHVDDLAEALSVLMETYEGASILNVGTGEDLSIAALAEEMRAVVGFTGDIRFDPSKPDGTPRKVLDVSKIRALGWAPKYSLSEGLRSTYQWALSQGIFDSEPEKLTRASNG